MGYLVYRATKAEAVQRELSDLQAHCTLLDSRLIGTRLWFLAERNGIRWIGLTLIESSGRDVAVKHMDESVGPYYYDCPLSYLRNASAPQGDYAGPWREKVLAFHAQRALQRARRSLAASGQRVCLASEVYVLEQSLGRRGWAVTRERDGLRMRLRARHMRLLEWLPAQTSAAEPLAPQPNAPEPPGTTEPPGLPRPALNPT